MDSLFEGVDLPEEDRKKLTAAFQAELTSQVEGAKNDPDFIAKIKGQEAGKFFGSIESKFKSAFGISPDDVDPELTGYKRVDAMLKLGLDRLKENNTATNQDLQNQLIAANEKYENYVNNEVPILISNAESKFTKTLIDRKIIDETSDIETTGNHFAKITAVDLYCHQNGLKKVWNTEKEDFDFVTNDNLKPLKEGKALTKLDIFKDAFEFSGIAVKSNGGGNGGDPPKLKAKLPEGVEITPAIQKELDRLAAAGTPIEIK